MLTSIYPRIHGEHREVKAETDTLPNGPFDSPDVIVGRLTCGPTVDELREAQTNEVLYEGEVYAFHELRSDGTFELRKAGQRIEW